MSFKEHVNTQPSSAKFPSMDTPSSSGEVATSDVATTTPIHKLPIISSHSSPIPNTAEVNEQLAFEVGTSTGQMLKKRKTTDTDTQMEKDNNLEDGGFSLFANVLNAGFWQKAVESLIPLGWLTHMNEVTSEELSEIYNKAIYAAAVTGNVMDAKLKRMDKELSISTAKLEKLTQHHKCNKDSEVDKESRKELFQSKQTNMHLQQLLEAERSKTMIMKDALKMKEAIISSLQADIQMKDSQIQANISDLEKMYIKCTSLVTDVIPHVCRTLVGSAEFGKLLDSILTANRQETEANMLHLMALQVNMQVTTKELSLGAPTKVQEAKEALKNAKFQYLTDVTANPDAEVDEFFHIKPRTI